MGLLRKLIGIADRWQRRNRYAGVTYGVLKKFGDDNANLLVVSLGWYGFTAIFPLLLVVVTIFGFVGQKSLGTGIVSTLHKFPVVGTSFDPSSGSHLHGSVVGLTIGLLGLLYGAQGVTQVAQQAMAEVWNIPQNERIGFLPRLGRSLLALVNIGGAFVINAFASTYATGPSESYAIRAPIVLGLVVINVGFFYGSFRVLTPGTVETGKLLPGAIAGAVGFTLLITVGTGLLTHQLKQTSETYGTFGSVIGIVAFLLLLSKLTLYAAELNPVLDRKLYPRSLPLGDPTEADEQVNYDLVHQEQRRTDESIGVGFGSDATDEAARDAAATGAGESGGSGASGDSGRSGAEGGGGAGAGSGGSEPSPVPSAEAAE